MKCRLTPLEYYSFDLRLETNPMALTYTLIASPEVCLKIDIQTYGFRYLTMEDEYKLVLILKGNQREKSQYPEESMGEIIQLSSPYSILNWIQNREVILERRPIKIESIGVPQLPIASCIYVYINSQDEFADLVKNIISRGPFVVNSGYHYIDTKWLECTSKQQIPWRQKAHLKQLLLEDSKGLYKNYFKVYIELRDSSQKSLPSTCQLFKPGASKLQFILSQLHPSSQLQIVRLPQLYQQIFELREYVELQMQFQKVASENKLCVVESEEGVGLEMWLHDFAQRNIKEFRVIPCKQFSSSKQLRDQIYRTAELQNSVILLKDLHWMEDVSKAESANYDEIKQIITGVEEDYQKACSKTFRKHTLVIHHQPEQSLPIEKLRSAASIPFKLTQETQRVIFKKIFSFIDENFERQLEIIEALTGKIGWQTFFGIMKTQWVSLKLKSTEDILKSLQKKGEKIENIAAVSWDDIGGLETAKEEITQTILLPIRHPQIFDEWIKPRTGLLFYGPPGTGKTLLGKCIAKECRMSFISVKGPELLNMYVGESEKNVRQIFERAAANRPCIVFMDELDALIPKRGNSGDSNQVMDRIVAELLMQMDTASAKQVFIIGATNRPDLLDPSILRPGRFDKQIYLGISNDPLNRIKILKAQTRKLALSDKLDFNRIVQAIPQEANFTGADFYALTSKAMMSAVNRSIEVFDREERVEQMVLREEDFISSVALVKPSVSKTDLERYEQLKKVYS